MMHLTPQILDLVAAIVLAVSPVSPRGRKVGPREARRIRRLAAELLVALLDGEEDGPEDGGA